MGAVGEILERIKLSCVVYFKADFSAPWGMDVPKGAMAQFHMLTEGECILQLQHDVLKLSKGDIVVFPWGTNHWLASDNSCERMNGVDLVTKIRSGQSVFNGEGQEATLVCGHFEFNRSLDHPFIQTLPKFIHIKGEQKKDLIWLENIVQLIMLEAEEVQSGKEWAISKLGEILFLHVLRAYVETNKRTSGFLAAVSDRKIGKAIEAIHKEPQKPWQIHTLAGIAGMSRTGFSNRFREMTGQTVLTYLTNWRVLKAKALLEESKKTVGEIALEVGYQSEASFNRVFKKNVAQTPLKYRQSVS